jgi:uracil phosphoribosyltransferase
VRSMLQHRYGPQAHLFDDAYLLSLLARLASPETGTEIVPGLVTTAYQRMLQEVLAREFPTERRRLETRMTQAEPQADYQGTTLCRKTKLVICAVIRAGILPAQVCYQTATAVLPPENVRLDFLNMSREVDGAHRVTGVRLDGSKIGGPAADAVLLVPDPMGATGGTIQRVAEIYRNLEGGVPRKVVAMHLMATPEAITRLAKKAPDVTVYSARLDRGMSAADVLASVPGTHPDRERGLNATQYIVPGAGGLGELLTNSWI